MLSLKLARHVARTEEMGENPTKFQSEKTAWKPWGYIKIDFRKRQSEGVNGIEVPETSAQ